MPFRTSELVLKFFKQGFFLFLFYLFSFFLPLCFAKSLLLCLRLRITMYKMMTCKLILRIVTAGIFINQMSKTFYLAFYLQSTKFAQPYTTYSIYKLLLWSYKTAATTHSVSLKKLHCVVHMHICIPHEYTHMKTNTQDANYE